MATRNSLCVEFSEDISDWLVETARACNTTPQDVVRLLVMAPVFMENAEKHNGELPDVGRDPSNGSGKTQVLMQEALSKIYDATRRQSVDEKMLRNEVRSMFEMMNDA